MGRGESDGRREVRQGRGGHNFEKCRGGKVKETGTWDVCGRCMDGGGSGSGCMGGPAAVRLLRLVDQFGEPLQRGKRVM